jgi:hypothetical protein
MIAGMSSTSRRADMFIDSENDPREDGPTLGDERATLVEFLRCQRLTLELKCSGLDAADLARRSVEPSQCRSVMRWVGVVVSRRFGRG